MLTFNTSSRMKHTNTITLAFALLITTVAGAQSIDKPAATVRLVQLDVISVRQLREQITVVERQAGGALTEEQRREVLDLLVAEALIDQAAERDAVVVAATEIDTRIEQLKQQNAQSLNLDRPLTDQEFRSLVAQTGMSWEDYRGQLGKALLQQRYVTETKAELFRNLPLPDNDAVREFYEQNKTTVFVQPDLIRFKHIYVDTRTLTTPEAREAAHTRANEIVRELENGGNYDDLVVRYSDDNASRYTGGIFGNGFLRRDDRSTLQIVGRPFFDAVFRLAPNTTSGVLESSLGLHIVKVVDYVPARILQLNDPVAPGQPATVEQQIRALLVTNAQSQLYTRALTELLEELREQATVRVFEENLVW